MEPDNLDTRFKEFVETIRKMAAKSAEEAMRHLEENEASLQFPFHDGETGSLELSLDYLTDLTKNRSSVSANMIEEAYFKLLVSLERMKGNVSALERIIKTMQATFDLPAEEDMERAQQDAEVPRR